MKTHVTRTLIAIVLTIGASLAGIHAQIPQDSPRKGQEIPRPHPRVGIPDLVCRITGVGGVVTVNCAAELPITVVVTNQGLFDVGKFKVSVEYKRLGFNQVFIAEFRVPGQQNETYPWVESLGQGRSVRVAGTLRFDPAANNERVSIRALADSCVNEVGMPGWCRAHESDERNNKSAPKLVSLP